MYLQSDTKTFDFSSLGVKFDVILLEPPLEEYQRRASGVTFSWSPWDWEEVRGEARQGREGRGEGGMRVGNEEGSVISSSLFTNVVSFIHCHDFIKKYIFSLMQYSLQY